MNTPKKLSKESIKDFLDTFIFSDRKKKSDIFSTRAAGLASPFSPSFSSSYKRIKNALDIDRFVYCICQIKNCKNESVHREVLKIGKLTILCGNIVDNEILSLGDAIVLPTNPMMRCGSGVSGAIFKKAGVDLLEQYCEKTFGISYYNEPGKNEMKVTEVRVTPGFSLPCKILFAQGPKRYEYVDLNEALFDLKKTYENVLKAACEQGFHSILLPALGTGEYGFSHFETAKAVMKTLYEYSSVNNIDLFFVVYNQSDKAIYDRAVSFLY